MKITRIRVREVAIPLLKSYTISRVGTLTKTGSVVLEMDTDQGLTGVGESDPALMFTGESQHTVMAVLRHHLGPSILARLAEGFDEDEDDDLDEDEDEEDEDDDE